MTSLEMPATPMPHVVPETASDERLHIISDDCWCGPRIEDGVCVHDCGHEQPCERHPL